MKLKTLKDIDHILDASCGKAEKFYRESLIKKEAIKWVKEYPFTFTKETFMEFHNITEEDLNAK